MIEPLEIRTIQTIAESDFSRLVREVYGRPYSYQQQDGCKGRGVENFTVPIKYPYDFENDVVIEEVNSSEEGVSFKAWLERDPDLLIEQLTRPYITELWWARNFYPSFDMVVNDLHSKGYIPAGEYQLVIDW
jgi:hypothetical protein